MKKQSLKSRVKELKAQNLKVNEIVNLIKQENPTINVKSIKWYFYEKRLVASSATKIN
jgi:hypothetical protein